MGKGDNFTEGKGFGPSSGGPSMGIDPLSIVTGALDLGGGIASAVMARNAYKHRYQDEVKDLRAAGLNPALAYGNSPGIPPTTTLPDVGSAVARGQSSALAAKMAQAQINKTNQETEYLKQSMPDRLKLPGAQVENLLGGAEQHRAQAQLTGLEGSVFQQTFDTQIKMQAQRLANLVAQGNEVQARAELEKLTAPQKEAIAEFIKSIMPFLKTSARGMDRLFSLFGGD